jgi:hypothetical protein
MILYRVLVAASNAKHHATKKMKAMKTINSTIPQMGYAYRRPGTGELIAWRPTKEEAWEAAVENLAHDRFSPLHRPPYTLDGKEEVQPA